MRQSAAPDGAVFCFLVGRWHPPSIPARGPAPIEDGVAHTRDAKSSQRTATRKAIDDAGHDVFRLTRVQFRQRSMDAFHATFWADGNSGVSSQTLESGLIRTQARLIPK